jgi:GH15 family glucan-1,4-alpha-glucosidase
VWVRDLAQVTGGLLAAGAGLPAAQVLRYLAVTQQADGSWPQNMWVRGAGYWHGEQMDQCAVVLVQARFDYRFFLFAKFPLPNHASLSSSYAPTGVE